MSSIRGGLLVSLAERYLLLVINLASNLIIARLLSPTEIGLYSVTVAVIGIAQVLRDFGIGGFIVQASGLTKSHLKTASGILWLLGGGIFLSIFFLAPLISRAYSAPAMVAVLQIAAFNFLLLPLSTISLALLRRDMEFKKLAAIGVASTLAGAVTSVALSHLQCGAAGLAIGALVVNLVVAAGAFFTRRESAVLRPGLTEWRSIVGYGTQTSVAGVITGVAMDINDLAVGRVLGFDAVAIMSRAQGLMNLFHRDIMSAIRNVAFPAYAKASRDGHSMEPIYLLSLSHVTAVSWPFHGFVSLFPLEILRTMFGPQWDLAAPLVPVFCLAGAIAALGSLIASLMTAVGRIDLVTKVELIFQPLRAVGIVVAAVIFQTPVACAWALVLAMAMQIPLLYLFKARCVPSTFSQIFRYLMKCVGIAVLTLAVPAMISFLFRYESTNSPHWYAFLVAIPMGLFGWIVSVVLLRHPIASDPLFLRLTAKVLPLSRRDNAGG